MENQTMEPQVDQQGAPEDSGRGTDTVLAHMSLGEVVIPRAFLDDPQVMEMLQQIFQAGGADIAEFTVGDKANKINPDTGYPEFFSFGKFLRKAAAIALPVIGAAVGGPIGGALGGAAGGAISGGGIKGSLIGGLTGGVGAGITGASGSLFSPGGLLEGTSLGGINSSILNTLSPIGKSISSAIGGLPGSVLSGGVGPTEGSGILGTVGKATGLTNASIPSLGGLFGGNSGGGGSTFGGSGMGSFNLGSSLASALGGVNSDSAIKKAQKQLLASNAAQQANLQTFDPSGITSDPGYQFNLAQGQLGLDRANSAAGSNFSGRALKAASQYNQDYANNAFNNYYQRWANQTGAQNTLLGQQGNINSSSTMNGANNLASSLSGVLNPTSGISQQDLLKLLSRQAA